MKKYILDNDAIISSVDGIIKLDNVIRDKQLFEFEIIDREDYIENLIGWIAECKTADKHLMKIDLKMLMNSKEDFLFSSISTNDFMGSSSERFESTCEELISLNKEISDFKENWGQSHEEICCCLGYDEEDSEDLLVEDYFWIESDEIWINRNASDFTEREKEIADLLID
jgi:hypothetical protein